MHSQKYRRAGDFKDKEVLLVGVGPSGIDIAIEILSCAKKGSLLIASESV